MTKKYSEMTTAERAVEKERLFLWALSPAFDKYMAEFDKSMNIERKEDVKSK